MNVVRSTYAGQVILKNAVSNTSPWNMAIIAKPAIEKPANTAKSLMTSLATNHVHFNVKNPMAYSIARSREASLTMIAAIDVTKYTWRH